MALPVTVNRISLHKWWNPFTWGKFRTKRINPIGIKVEINGEHYSIPLYIIDKEDICQK